MNKLSPNLPSAPTIVCILSLTITSIATVGHAESINLPAAMDNTLFFAEPDGNINSNGTGPLFTGLTGGLGPGAQRAVMAFDIVSAIPAGSTITDVELTLTVQQAGSGSGFDTYSLHRLTNPWGEGTSEATGGAGTAATTGDATWLHTFFANSFWNTPGGDFEPTASAEEVIGIFGDQSWGSTAAMVADVQSWLDNPDSNYGWILIGDETASASSRKFGSRESDLGAPVLAISYIVPEPATLFLGALGTLCLSVFGRRTSSRKIAE